MGAAIRKVCARFVELCRKMGLLASASVAIDGSKFKAVNNRDRNFTRGKVERRRAQLEESVARYLEPTRHRRPAGAFGGAGREDRHLKEKLAKLKEEMAKLAALEKRMLAAPDQQISLTDPDSRSMATSGRGSGVVGYNVQVAVDTEHHLIVTHEVTNVGSDRAQLANMAKQAKAVLEVDELEAVADRGYYQRRGDPGVRAGRYHGDAAKADDVGREVEGPLRQAGLRLSRRGRRLPLPGRRAAEILLHQRRGRLDAAPLLDQCVPELPDQRAHARQGCSAGFTRWEHEHVLEAVQKRLDENPKAMRVRRETVEHPFGTIKARMGATHFFMKTLPRSRPRWRSACSPTI